MKEILEVVGAVLGALLMGAAWVALWFITPDQNYGAPAPTSLQQ